MFITQGTPETRSKSGVVRNVRFSAFWIEAVVSMRAMGNIALLTKLVVGTPQSHATIQPDFSTKFLE